MGHDKQKTSLFDETCFVKEKMKTGTQSRCILFGSLKFYRHWAYVKYEIFFASIIFFQSLFY